MRKALLYSKKLEKVGLTRDQAEVHLEILADVVEDEMATKADIAQLENEISSLRSDMGTEFKAVRSEMRNGFQKLEDKMTIKLGLMLVAFVGVMTTLKFF